MKHNLKQIVLSVLYGAYRLVSVLWRPQIVVSLMYHSVGPGSWEFSVKPEIFRKQIQYLSDKKFSFISTADISEWLNGGNRPPRRSVLITFDDGYKDFLTHALPILKEYKATGTLFIHGNRSGDMLGSSPELMSWEDIRQVQNFGIEIGDHSFSHPNLKHLSPEELRQELNMSGKTFRNELESKPYTFAYPGGKYNNSVKDFLRGSGYWTAFSINRGLISRSDDPLTLKRTGISQDTSWLEFKTRVTPASDWYEKIRKWI